MTELVLDTVANRTNHTTNLKNNALVFVAKINLLIPEAGREDVVGGGITEKELVIPCVQSVFA